MCWLRRNILCTSLIFGIWRFCTSKNNYFYIYNMKQLFQDINIDSIMTFLKELFLTK